VAGVASAVLSLLMMLTGALSTAIVSALYDGRTPIAMTGVMAVFSLGALALYAGYVHPLERERAK
jgi:MFS transporter, DHA1 family, multidrug resistance protein